MKIIKNKNMNMNPKILDIGCRYGIYDQFKKFKNDCVFFMVDADEKEIKRLKKKYKKFKNLKFFPECLGEINTTVKFKVFNHKGYNSIKTSNKNTLWFNQKNEKQIIKIREKKQKQIKSIEFIKREKFIPDIVKVDIEGAELNFLRGLENKISKVKFFILEATFENTFISDTNFGSVHDYMLENNFTLITMRNEKSINLNIFSNSNDQIPGVVDAFYMNRSCLNPLTSLDFNLILNLLLILDHDQLLFEILLKFKNKYKISKKNIFYNNLKKKIAMKLTQKIKEPFYDYVNANKFFKSLFSEKLPYLSDLNESNFYNSI